MELAFLGMELHQPFLTPIVFLEDLCVGNAVDGSVDDGVIRSEEPDVGVYAVSDVVDIHQEEELALTLNPIRFICSGLGP